MNKIFIINMYFDEKGEELGKPMYKVVIIYIRLSKENVDRGYDESKSIKNQRILPTKLPIFVSTRRNFYGSTNEKWWYEPNTSSFLRNFIWNNYRSRCFFWWINRFNIANYNCTMLSICSRSNDLYSYLQKPLLQQDFD